MMELLTTGYKKLILKSLRLVPCALRLAQLNYEN